MDALEIWCCHAKHGNLGKSNGRLARAGGVSDEARPERPHGQVDEGMWDGDASRDSRHRRPTYAARMRTDCQCDIRRPFDGGPRTTAGG